MSDFDPERIFHELVVAGEDWADKEAAAEMLEENKKTLLAELMIDKQGTSSAEKERLALADAAYKLHLKQMVIARKEANRAKVRYDSMKVLADMRRTQSANRRAEMNLR